MRSNVSVVNLTPSALENVVEQQLQHGVEESSSLKVTLIIPHILLAITLVSLLTASFLRYRSKHRRRRQADVHPGWPVI